MHFKFSSQGWGRFYKSFKWPSVTKCFRFCTSYSGLNVASFIFNQDINSAMHFWYASTPEKLCLHGDVSCCALQDCLSREYHCPHRAHCPAAAAGWAQHRHSPCAGVSAVLSAATSAMSTLPRGQCTLALPVLCHQVGMTRRHSPKMSLSKQERWW